MCFLNQSNKMKTFQKDNSKKLWGHVTLNWGHVPICFKIGNVSPISAKG